MNYQPTTTDFSLVRLWVSALYCPWSNLLCMSVILDFFIGLFYPSTSECNCSRVCLHIIVALLLGCEIAVPFLHWVSFPSHLLWIDDWQPVSEVPSTSSGNFFSIFQCIHTFSMLLCLIYRIFLLCFVSWFFSKFVVKFLHDVSNCSFVRMGYFQVFNMPYNSSFYHQLFICITSVIVLNLESPLL